jgi:hypothetical protein
MNALKIWHENRKGLPKAFGRLWDDKPDAIANAIGHGKHRSRSHCVVIRVYDEAVNMIDTHDHVGDFKEW